MDDDEAELAALLKEQADFLRSGKPPAAIDDFSPLLERRESVYALTKRISGVNRQKELKPHADGGKKFAYTLEPGTRYASWSEAGGGRDAAAGGAKSKFAAKSKATPSAVTYI